MSGEISVRRRCSLLRVPSGWSTSLTIETSFDRVMDHVYTEASSGIR